MPSLLLTVFILQLVIHLINTLGVSTVNALLWNLYNRLPTSNGGILEQRKLQAEFLRLRKELNATSSQDEFAKWAKLRRQHDKILEQLEKKKASSDSTKATFDQVVGALRWILTTGLRFFMQFHYTKQPMFWIPKGWIPYYAEWLLSFPKAPLGSISIQTWTVACGSVILLASDAITAIIGLIMEARAAPVKQAKRTEAPIKADGKPTGDSKKEL